jgi:CRISPR-associated protein Cas4
MESMWKNIKEQDLSGLNYCQEASKISKIKNVKKIKMYNHIAISTLNDFIFCPYSIYLHNVYMGGDEELVHATPQTRGKAAHGTIDNKIYSSKKDEISGLSVFCNELGIVGKIDIYKAKEKLLIERKYQLANIYRGSDLSALGRVFLHD